MPTGSQKLNPDVVSLIEQLKRDGPYFGGRADHYADDPLAWGALNDQLEACESPIEQLLFVALAFNRPDLMTVIMQQEVLYYSWERPGKPIERIFRPDFIIGLAWAAMTPRWERAQWYATMEFPNGVLWLPMFAVECDGRDYHNDHVAIERDKARDRILTSRGLPVLRFTGTEINRNVEGCAIQVIDMFYSMLRNRLKAGIWPEEFASSADERIVLGLR